MLKGIYLICSLLSMVFTLGDFTNVWLLTGGAPGDSTHVLATLAYRYVPDGQDRLGDGGVRHRPARHPPLHLHPDQEDPMSPIVADWAGGPSWPW